MIAKSHRFHGHNSLSTVYRKGTTVSLPNVSLKYLLIKPEKQYRLSVVVSRKVDKSSVIRNRIRRRIYEAIRKKQAYFKKNADIVISVHSKQLADLKANELDELINQLLIKAELLEP